MEVTTHPLLEEEGLRFVTTILTGLFVMISGTFLMLELCADNWNFRLQVITYHLVDVQHDIHEHYLNSASVPVRRSMYGSGSVAFLLDNIVCSGNESNLLQCVHSGLGIHNCDSSETAGVICGGMCCN